MPDLFDGDLAPNAKTNIEADQVTPEQDATSSFLDLFRIKAAETAKSFLIDMWLARHTEEKVMPILQKTIDGCKDEFADAVSNGGGIYAAGYCFGGRYVLLLASEIKPAAAGGGGIAATFLSGGSAQKPADEESGAAAAATQNNGPFIKAGVVAHATLVAKDDFEGLKAPVSMACVENDPLFPDEVRKYGEDYLSKSGLEHEVQVYPGVPHGKFVTQQWRSCLHCDKT